MNKNKKKIFILLPDGVGLRNFAFSEFYKLGIELNYDVVFWDKTLFNLSEIDVKNVKIKNLKSNPKTDLYKRSRKNIEISQFSLKFSSIIFKSYLFKSKWNSLKGIVKNIIVKWFSIIYNSENGLEILREKIVVAERNSEYYKHCLKTLKEEAPDFVLCTNQRSVLAIAPITAAKDLKIPTATFIFSWDNLPKATLVVEPDYYFVWSKYMQNELIKYYPFLPKENIIVAGTPQFEFHFDNSLMQTRDEFFEIHNLDLNKKYFCYSGDDITTCPDDPTYLRDLAESVGRLNNLGHNFAIIIRRCPVDFSSRFNKVLSDYSHIITEIKPLWKQVGNNWNTVLPTKEDMKLLYNIAEHCELVINLGSSMVFDFVAHNKPCCYINYDVPNKVNKNWSVETIYNYIHFQSMPNKEVVFWIESKTNLDTIILEALNDTEKVKKTKDWFKVINIEDPTKSSQNIWKAINRIV